MATSVVMLGTGNPNPDPMRSGPSVAVIVDGQAYIVDSGPGVVRKAQAAYLKGVEAIRPDRLDRLFLTHLHSDHTAGLPDIILTPWIMERASPMTIIGPEGTEQMVRHITYAYEKDIMVRQRGLEKANDVGWRSIVKEIGPGPVYRDDRVDVSAFKVLHGAWDHSFGYRFITNDGCIVISGDCTPSPGSVENYMGADILVHEVYSVTGFESRSAEWKAYHSGSHTSSMQLARIASVVRPRLLVLYHQLLWGVSEKCLLEEIKELYEGPVVSSMDLDIFDL
ncbi:MAG: MBL fold metallo-hydrolase [Candidatus Thermoplasmatota archaeon]|nr:MBL fold metallo-hydrolase [Candidatus Thermoplasmatota archaeon]